MSTVDTPAPLATRLREVAVLFLRLGCTAFGGPAAHVALIEDEVVRRRRWLEREEFLDLLSACNLIPGPNSTELVIHLGLRRAGPAGLVVAGLCFILPAALLVTGFAWFHTRFGRLPAVGSMLDGLRPVIIAIVLQALIGLGRTAIRTRPAAVLALVAAGATLAGIHELGVLLGAGLAMAVVRTGRKGTPFLPLAAALPAVATGPAFGLGPLFLFFLKVGSVLFGSGYVLLAFLRADLVDRWHWLTEAQLLDAIAVGQFTPGPLFTTATFVGYLLGGLSGAAVATIGIFLPAFVFVALSGPLVPRLRRSAFAGAFLDGVNAASLALMAVVTLQLGRAALGHWSGPPMAIASAIALLRYRVNSVWLVLAGALIGALLGRL